VSIDSPDRDEDDGHEDKGETRLFGQEGEGHRDGPGDQERGPGGIQVSDEGHQRHETEERNPRVALVAILFEASLGFPLPEVRASLTFPLRKGERRGPRVEAFIEGRVLDETGNPIPNALILLDDGQNVYTDREGRFRLYTSPGRHTVTLDSSSLPDDATILSPKSQPAVARPENPPPITFRVKLPRKEIRETIFKGS